MSQDEQPQLPIESAEEWERWLSEQPEDSPGVWLKLGKKGKGVPVVPYARVLDTALCHGWIDGQRKALDDAYFLQKFTPRRPRSVWSKRNCEHVKRLIESGRMRPSGMRQVELAKADGRWDAAYEGQKVASVPDDLQRELDAHPRAAEFFATLNSQNRYAILYRLQTAKKPETRARRLTQFVEMLDAGEKIHP
jgi:uncharacterized protein YdeI (YjbR/CyaY-like superfamily)